MQGELKKTTTNNVAIWLFAGVTMLIVQILLGGITRLTESGLSITEWKPISGILPPLNTEQWMTEFDRYKQTDQFRYMNNNFSLSEFKFIFFWEWFHRTWARLMGVVFLVGFFYFLIKRQLKQDMIGPFIILFLLGMMQGIIGWVMVKSGLVPERMFVGHIELTTHFMAALVLLGYTLWFALTLSIRQEQIIISKGLRKFTLIIFCILFFQFIYGAFMAGLHAATSAPTWPQINGQWIPDSINDISPGWKNFIDNKIAIQFIHRFIAYILLIGVFLWYMKSIKINGSLLFNKTKIIPLIFIIVQVLLGIMAVITSPYGNNLVWFGVAHQLVAILFFITIIFMLFIIRSSALPKL